jgi:hypothetical protein
MIRMGRMPRIKKQERVRWWKWERLVILEYTIWSYARFAMEKGKNLIALVVLVSAKNVGALDFCLKQTKAKFRM